MEIMEFCLKFCLILVSAKVLAELFAYLRLPAVIGEVMAGVVIGPSVLGVVGQEHVFVLLADIGVLFLLFHVGLETDIGKLIAVGGQSALVAVTGVAAPFIAAVIFSFYVFNMPYIEAMFIGGTLVATSIGITLRVLRDLGRHRTHEARVVLGAAVLDDLIGVIVLALLISYRETGRVELAPSLKVLVFMAVFLAAAPVLGPWLRRLLSKLSEFSRTPGSVPMLVVVIMLLLSVTANSFGAPEIIGAFAAGLALSGKSLFFSKKEGEDPDRSVSEWIERKVVPVGELFTPFFFVMVGVSMNLKAVDFGSSAFWAFAGSLTVIAFLSKLISGVWVKGSLRSKTAVGVAMVPRGEVGLVFAQAGLSYAVFSESVYTSMVFIVAITTLIAPAVLKLVMKGEDASSTP